LSASIQEIRCHVCAATDVEPVHGFADLCRVTSDCKPWPRGGRLCVCRVCRCVQRVVDDVWLAEIECIYGEYAIYYQSEGAEQAVFDVNSGQPSPRSVSLLQALAAHLSLPAAGRMLDLGCGNGAMLRAFSSFAPGWTLTGAELNDKNRAAVESIERVEKLYTCAPEEIPGTFDLISMIHMLEHIPGPVKYLSNLKNKLKAGGLLVIQVPNYLQNPFDLLVADHASHFTPLTAATVLRGAGFQVVSIATDWIPKELSIVARRVENDEAAPRVDEDRQESAAETVKWLRNTVCAAQQAAGKGSFGIFGTSIAATWLFAEMGDVVSFFVDEDPARIGKTFMGRKVYPPGEVPRDSQVFMALTPGLAEMVKNRVAPADVNFHVPPALPTFP
jgi:SAM-dependent methyltransferase